MPETRLQRKLRRFQKFQTKQAAYYRRGFNVRNERVFNEIIANLNLRPHPLRDRRREVHHGFTVPRNRMIYNALTMGLANNSLDQLGNTEDAIQTRVRINRMARKALRVGVRFRQMLYRGGMGVTALFEVRNRQGQYNKCVVKMALPGGEAGLVREKAVLQALKGAPHIVQIHSAQELRGMAGGYDSEPVHGVLPQNPPGHASAAETQRFDRDPSILMMEYVRMGNMDYWIDFCGDRNIPYPENVLWNTLSCLVKGCIAMAYPPQNQLRNNGPGRADPMEEYVPSDDELRRNRRRNKFANYVHFDLDPSNIFVDGFCDDEHEHMPRFKLADFGLAEQADKTYLRNAEKLWRARMIGKFGYMTPEQWTAEWELVKDNPLYETPEDQPLEIAGRYGAATNVWQMGMVMLNFITQLGAEFPPYARRVRLPRVREDDVLYRNFPRRTRFVLSHGYMLEDPSFDGKIDREMRNVIMACLAYKPAERPSLADLEEICNARLADGFPNGNPNWAHFIFTRVHGIPERMPTVAYNDRNGAVQEEVSEDEEDEDETEEEEEEEEEEDDDDSGDDGDDDNHGNGQIRSAAHYRGRAAARANRPNIRVINGG